MTEKLEGSKVARAEDDVTLVRRYIQAKPQLRARTKRTDILEALDRIVAALSTENAKEEVPPPCQECGAERGWYGFCERCGADQQTGAMKRVAKRASDRADKVEAELREAKWGDRYAIVEATKLLEASHLTRALNVLRNATSSEDATRPTGGKE